MKLSFGTILRLTALYEERRTSLRCVYLGPTEHKAFIAVLPITHPKLHENYVSYRYGTPQNSYRRAWEIDTKWPTND